MESNGYQLKIEERSSWCCVSFYDRYSSNNRDIEISISFQEKDSISKSTVLQ